MSMTSLQYFHLTVHVIKAWPLQMHSGFPCDPRKGFQDGRFLQRSPAFDVCSEAWLHLLSVLTDRDTFPAGP